MVLYAPPHVINRPRQERRPTVTDLVTQNFGKGLGNEILKNVLEQNSINEQQKEQSIIDQALANVNQNDPNQVMQALQNAAVPQNIKQQYFKNYSDARSLGMPHSRAQEIGNYYKQNPQAAPQDALAAGYTPAEIHDFQAISKEKPNAALEQLRYTQFTDRVNNIIGKDNDSELAPFLREFAYRKFLDYRDQGFHVSSAMNRAFDDLRVRTKGLQKLEQIAESPNLVFSNTLGSKMKELRKNFQKMMKSGEIEEDELRKVLESKGWNGAELDLLTSSKATDEIKKYFLKLTRNNIEKAKKEIKKYGFELEDEEKR